MVTWKKDTYPSQFIKPLFLKCVKWLYLSSASLIGIVMAGCSEHLICLWGRDLLASEPFNSSIQRIFVIWQSKKMMLSFYPLTSIECYFKAEMLRRVSRLFPFISLWLGVSNSNHIRSFITLKNPLTNSEINLFLVCYSGDISTSFYNSKVLTVQTLLDIMTFYKM